MLKGTPIAEGFYSSTRMKLTLKDIVITSMTVSDDPEGGQIVSLTLNFAPSEQRPMTQAKQRSLSAVRIDGAPRRTCNATGRT